jgi:hypothetical protein
VNSSQGNSRLAVLQQQLALLQSKHNAVCVHAAELAHENKLLRQEFAMVGTSAGSVAQMDTHVESPQMLWHDCGNQCVDCAPNSGVKSASAPMLMSHLRMLNSSYLLIDTLTAPLKIHDGRYGRGVKHT